MPGRSSKQRRSLVRPDREHLPASALPEVLYGLGEIGFGAAHGNPIAVADGMKNFGKVGKKKR